MSEKEGGRRPSFLSYVSEDWWAVIVGFGLVILVYLSVLRHVPW